jgi:hypothetical protein
METGVRRDAGFATFGILVVGLRVGVSSALFSVVKTPGPFRRALVYNGRVGSSPRASHG